MEIVYAAHTESGVFMLDGRGVCRWAVGLPGRTQEMAPERLVGAQYVATLDLDTSGGLVDLPRVGCPMLFAVTDESGRIRLLRTPPVLRFEDRRTAIRDEDEENTAPASTPPLPLVRRPQQSFSGALPPPPILPRLTPLPPPPKGRIAARLPSPPHERGRSPSGIRPAPWVAPISVPVRVRAGNMSIKRLVRGR